MKAFPTEKDIQRLENMAQGDYGFFVLAVYSFIEKYMKNAISIKVDDLDDKNTFRQIIYQYIGYLRKMMWVDPRDNDFLFSMTNGKEKANAVRHQFKSLTLEEATAAIQDLLHFFEIADNDIKSAFKNLRSKLSNWDKREAPKEDAAKELIETNKKLSDFQKNLPTMILESDDYKKLQAQIEELKTKCLELEKEDNESKGAVKKLEKQIKEYQDAEASLNERFGEYEEYIQDLKRMLAYTRTRNDFEHTILRLSPEQEDAVNRIKFKQDYLIKGPAGTGKSLVLLKSIENLLKENENNPAKPKILFITFTNSLVKYNLYVAKLMKMGIEEDCIKTADSFFNEILNTVLPGHFITYTNYEKEFGEILKKNYADQDIEKRVINNEASNFIWSNMVTKKEYLDEKIKRTGLKTALKKEQREIYWEIIQELEDKVKKSKNWFVDFAKLQVANELKNNPLENDKKIADYIFVDEGQDLSIASLFCLKSVCRESIVIAADNDQMIYQIQTPLKRAGINVVGNSITLKTNFRNTIQINDCSERYRKLIKGCNKEYTSTSFRMGPPVELMDIDHNLPGNEILKIAAKRTKIFIDELNYAPENICIIMSSFTKNQRYEKLLEELEKLGISGEIIKDKDFNETGKVCVSTIQSVKGLDFPVVILLAEHRFHSNDWKYSEEMVEKMQRNLIYVAMTRAMDMLTVLTWDNVDNSVIADLKKCCR